MPLLEYIISTIAPHTCLACHREGSLLCPPCQPLLAPAQPRCYRCASPCRHEHICRSCKAVSPLAALYVTAAYEGHAKELVHSLKFRRARAAVAPIARCISFGITPAEDIVISYVPTATKRVRIRGYDQAALIAKELSRISSLPCVSLLARSGQQRQLGQNQQGRRQQLQQAFRLVDAKLSKNTTVLLIDDVVTTGSTLEAAAVALRQAGFTSIKAVVFAAA